MQIKSIVIDDRSARQYANQFPEFMILTDVKPTFLEHDVQKLGDDTWITRRYEFGLISFALYHASNTSGAFGDEVDGVIYKGGWSSRPSVYNTLPFVKNTYMEVIVNRTMYYMPVVRVKELLAEYGLDKVWDVYKITDSETSFHILPVDQSDLESLPVIKLDRQTSWMPVV